MYKSRKREGEIEGRGKVLKNYSSEGMSSGWCDKLSLDATGDDGK